MSRRQEYNLNFNKVNSSVFSPLFICIGNENTAGSLELASLLRSISDKESDGLLEEVNLALTGGDYEEYYSPDGSAVDTIKITPPNAIYNDYYTISLFDLKELLEEWIDFINQNQ